jgi:hypothetical protein
MEFNQNSGLPMGKINIVPFGPNGVINSNNTTAIGQGLKKMFNPQIEIPRTFRSQNIPMAGENQSSGANGNNYAFSQTDPLSMSTFTESFEL